VLFVSFVVKYKVAIYANLYFVGTYARWVAPAKDKALDVCKKTSIFAEGEDIYPRLRMGKYKSFLIFGCRKLLIPFSLKI